MTQPKNDPPPNDLHPHAEIELSVTREGDALIAVLVAHNTSTKAPLELVRFALPGEDEDPVPIFAIETTDGIAPFKLDIAKRSAPGDGDFVTIAPGARAEWTADLRELYDVPGEGSLRVVYDAYHPTLTEPDELWRLRSNIVEVT